MQLTLFNADGQDDAAEENDVGFAEIAHAHLTSAHDVHHGQKSDRQ